jgi:hypothetical protein
MVRKQQKETFQLADMKKVSNTKDEFAIEYQ